VRRLELILQKELEHQQKALEAMNSALDKSHILRQSLYYTNPILDHNGDIVKNNISEIQKKICPEFCGCKDDGEYLNLDIKMETGTGKTYVYTNTIFEMHKQYGFNKFIIAVPSLAIKAGARQFIEDLYVKQHFKDTCGYNCNIELGVLETIIKKKGRFFFPSVAREFVAGSSQNTNKIFVLLVNMQLLTNGNMLTREDYDYGVEGFYRPFDALKATRPIVIIDEPHRFSRDQKAFKTIVSELEPQMIIRFGATFPEMTSGRGKNKVTIADYNNLIYDLNACSAFNKNLIKGIAKEHFEPISRKEEKVKITKVESKTSCNLQFKRSNFETKTYTLAAGDSLSVIDSVFEGLIISAIGKNYIELSNGQIKYQGEEFNTDIYSSSYQEQMIKLAIQRHFETEKQNFCGRKYKIKTLALLFIDDITSYRDKSKDGKEPYLKNMFESLLLERMDYELANITEYENEYKEYLIASKADISACHAGYFAQDNSDTDEDIAKEIYEILHNKKKLLSIRNEDGSYNTRRFLFSKWTLKEGWDNPNVFTIVKLRSSGSDISKLQEVGRGLRLPVDENGNRISNEDFKLNYIVDFTEADFANKLVDEINGEIPMAITITKEKIEEVAKKVGKTPTELFKELVLKDYIDFEYKIISENRDELLANYPEFSAGLTNGKVTDNNKTTNRKIRIRSACFNELKELWKNINQKYYLFYEDEINDEIPAVVSNILRSGVFGNVTLHSTRDIISSDGNTMGISDGSGVEYNVKKPLAYNEFLRRINIRTSIPISVMHKAMCEFYKKNGIIESQINEYSAANIVKAFQDWKTTSLQGRFNYSRSNQTVAETTLTNSDGTPKAEVVQGKIGVKIAEGTPCDKYLYDTIAYDSPLEKLNIEAEIDEVIVYGKIPRCSIAIPTIVGENYSPDFMYVVKKSNGDKELNVVVETKAVEGKSDLRGVEETKIKCAEVFFKQLTIDGYKVSFHTQLNNKKMKQILDEVLNSKNTTD
jgi:type III restriction enzyme